MQSQPKPMASGSQPVYYPTLPTVNVAHGGDPRGPQYRPPQSTSAVFSMNVAHSLTQLCLGGVIFSSLDIAIYVSSSFMTLKNHIILCTIGYFILMAQAILLFSPVGWANNLKQEHKRIIHATMQTIGSVLAVSGTLIQVLVNGFPLNNGHGICGLIAMIFTIISFIVGILNFIFSQKPKSKYFKILHASLGIVTMSVAFICLIFGLYIYIGDALYITVACFAFVGTLQVAVVNVFTQITDGDKSVNLR